MTGSVAMVGLIGPADVVAQVAAVAAGEFPALDLHPSPYAHEGQAVDLIRSAPDRIDAWLFTGPVPFDLARRAGVLRRPATFVDYTGATLYQALRADARRHWDVASVDTLRRTEVLRAFRAAGLPTERVRVCEYGAGRDVTDLAAFHRSVARSGGTALAITCRRSVYDAVGPSLPMLRLAPSAGAVRSALTATSLVCDRAVGADAQVVVGLVDVPASPELAAEVRRLAGVTAPLSPTLSVILTTRAVLAEETGSFRRLVMLDRLSHGRPRVHAGFGVGRTVAVAEVLARRALARATAAGPSAAVVSFGAGADLLLTGRSADAPGTGGTVSVAVAERRSGIEQTKLRRILAVAEADRVTAADVARSLAIEDRSARRLLERLVQAGVAEATTTRAGTVGRPPKSYLLRIASRTTSSVGVST
ncbi:hypothetical protein ACXJJ3_11620 [Kribbella sp. WER1]